MTDTLISYEAADPALARFGVRVHGEARGSVVMVHPGAGMLATPLEVCFQSGIDHCLQIQEGCQATGRVVFNGDGALVSLGGFANANFDLWMYGGSRFFWGERSICYGLRAWVHGEKSMTIGDDCLFSEGITLRTSDHHSIIDLTTLSQLNFPADLSIGRHVWIGPGVLVMKGVSIGDGSIVGSDSIVTRSIGRTELWAGSPARLIRRDVSWVDTHPAHPVQVAGLAAMGLVATSPE